MNLNLSKILKDSSFDFKDSKSINNWIRVLDTSGMSVVDQLILDNHRRQLLKSLYEEPKQEEKRLYSSMKSKNTSFTSMQSSQTKNSNISVKILNNSFLSIPDPQLCAERLYSDAYYRDSKLKKQQELKDLKEKEETLDYLNTRHPKRKLDPDVFNRLTHDERIIKHWYDKEGIDPGSNNKSSKRFSASEQKESVDRLVRSRGSSCKKSLENENSEKKMSNEELKAMIERLYKVKNKENFNIGDKRAKSVARPRKIMKNKMINELKSSKRYIESLDKRSEMAVESVCDGEGNGLCGDFQSPLRDKAQGEELEVKLLMLNKRSTSPAETEVNTGSPFDIDLRELYENNETGPVLSIQHLENFSSFNQKAKHSNHKEHETEDFSIITINDCTISEQLCKECLETNTSHTNSSPNPEPFLKIEEFSPEVYENFRDYSRPKPTKTSEWMPSTTDPNLLNTGSNDILNMTRSTLYNSEEKSFPMYTKFSNTESKDLPSMPSSILCDSEEKSLKIEDSKAHNTEPKDLLSLPNNVLLNLEDKSRLIDDNVCNDESKDLLSKTNNHLVNSEDKLLLIDDKVPFDEFKGLLSMPNFNLLNTEEQSLISDGKFPISESKDLLNIPNSTLSSQIKPENSLKTFPLPKSFYLEPEDLSSRDQATTFSQEALYLMQNPLQSMNSNSYSPKKVNPCILDSYRFIVGISENDEFIYAD